MVAVLLLMEEDREMVKDSLLIYFECVALIRYFRLEGPCSSE